MEVNEYLEQNPNIFLSIDNFSKIYKQFDQNQFDHFLPTVNHILENATSIIKDHLSHCKNNQEKPCIPQNVTNCGIFLMQIHLKSDPKYIPSMVKDILAVYLSTSIPYSTSIMGPLND